LSEHQMLGHTQASVSTAATLVKSQCFFSFLLASPHWLAQLSSYSVPRVNNWCSNQNPNKLHLDLLTNQSKHFLMKSRLFQSTQCLGETCS